MRCCDGAGAAPDRGAGGGGGGAMDGLRRRAGGDRVRPGEGGLRTLLVTAALVYAAFCVQTVQP